MNTGLLLVSAAVLILLLIIRNKIRKLILGVLLVLALLAAAWAIFGPPAFLTNVLTEEQTNAIDETIDGLSEKASDLLDRDGILPDGNGNLKISGGSSGITVTFSGDGEAEEEAHE